MIKRLPFGPMGVLFRLGMIDINEWLELNEMADARYAKAAGELLAGLDDV